MSTPEQDLIQAIGTISGSDTLLSELTPSGQLSVGGYALGVTDVVLGLVGGASTNPSDLAANATSMVAGLVTDLVGSLFGAASSAVPIVGQILGSVMGVLGSLQAAEEAEEARKKAEEEKACKAEIANWRTVGNGPWGAVLPADYFVQATRDYAGTWTIHREPFHGQFLRAVLAESWPRWFVESRSRMSQNETRRLMGHDVKPAGEPAPMFRTPLAEQVYLGLHQSERERYADVRNWPPRPREMELALKVLSGVKGQHPAILAQAGRPLGEAGREVWPLFCDLLYHLCRVPRPPWWGDDVPWENDPAVEALGLLPVPTLNEPLIRALYSAPYDSPILDSPSAPWVEWDRMARLENIGIRSRGVPLGSCRGYGTAGCNLLYGLADGWRSYALPVTQSDADTRDEQIREAWEWMADHLDGSGPGRTIAGRMRGAVGRERASRALGIIAGELGWTDQAQAQAQAMLEAEARVTAQTVRRAATTVALGAGAVGALGLALWFSR